MMRKCLDCGKELNDVEMKCSECGSDNLSEIIIEQTERKKMPPKKIAKIAAAAVAIIVALGIIIGGALMVIRNTQAQPVVNGVKAMMSGDLDGYVNSFNKAFQEKVQGALLQSTSADDFKTTRQDELKKTYGDDYKMYINAVTVKNCTDKTLAALNSDYSSYEITFQDAKFITVTVYITGSSGEYMTSKTIYSVKIDGEWSMFEDFSTDSTNTSESDSSK